MQTNLSESIKSRTEHQELDSILRSCVHCGFCNATCPTYQLLGDELDGPRGRIYLLKQMLEGEKVSHLTRQHLDRCLNCRSCETTCPSGVKYGRLLDLGQVILNEQIKRPLLDRMIRWLMLTVFPFRQRFNCLMRVARLVKPVVPADFKNKISSVVQPVKKSPIAIHGRKILLLSGCVQPTLAPNIDIAAANILDKLGISVLSVNASVCCGALNYHLSDHEKAKQFARKNIDACWPLINQEVMAIMMTSSACGLMLKEYATLLQYDEQYASKARLFSAKVKDISEIISQEDLSVINLSKQQKNQKIAFQSPCTLQHGQKLAGVVENLLIKTGFSLTTINDAHLCCGSAGVYSLLQADLSEQLKENKLAALQEQQADVIATANIGCLTHLKESADIEVVHWLELFNE